ncbi:unnamed protein product, partial [Polarella glacialis]
MGRACESISGASDVAKATTTTATTATTATATRSSWPLPGGAAETALVEESADQGNDLEAEVKLLLAEATAQLLAEAAAAAGADGSSEKGLWLVE